MLAVMKRFGLEVNLPSGNPRRAPLAAADGSPEAPEPERPEKPPRAPVPKTRFAVILVVALGLLSGVANASLRSFDLVSDSLGAPRLDAFLTHPDHPDGWTVRKLAQYDWAKPFFGDNSTWYRYQFTSDGRTPSDFHTTASVIADVIDTDDLSSFSTYGIEACYNFHGYELKSTNTVDLGGVVAHVLTYRNTAIHSDWTNVYWHWPVKTPNGTMYERVNLMIINSAKVNFTAPGPVGERGPFARDQDRGRAHRRFVGRRGDARQDEVVPGRLRRGPREASAARQGQAIQVNRSMVGARPACPDAGRGCAPPLMVGARPASGTDVAVGAALLHPSPPVN